jgi:hypothetical protein
MPAGALVTVYGIGFWATWLFLLVTDAQMGAGWSLLFLVPLNGMIAAAWPASWLLLRWVM